MDGKQFYSQIVVRGSAQLPAMDTAKARLMLLAISGTESEWTFRVQKPVAYAHGFWQFEKRGATLEVLTNDRVSGMAATLCAQNNVTGGLDEVFDAIIDHDFLACGFARLALWLNPNPLPELGQEAAAFRYYVNTWHPGKPDAARFARYYALSMSTVRSSALPSAASAPSA